MAALKDRITEDMKSAMRAKDSARLLTIRGLLAALKQREVDERIELDDAAVIAIVDKLVFWGSPNRVAFDLERVMRTKYEIDDFQSTYFVIDSFETLLDACYRDFGPVYDVLAAASDIEPFALTDGDEVLTRGTQAHFALRKR